MRIKFLIKETNDEFVAKNLDVDKAFGFLALSQRDEPEFAMLDAQRYAAGVLSPILEHVGDLTHRIAQHGLSDVGEMGHEALSEKVPNAIRRLTDQYGFEREVSENIKSNASYNKVPVEDFEKELRKRMQIYSETHSQLAVYNKLQYLCKMAAVSVGSWRFRKATTILLEIKQKLSLPIEQWIKEASEFRRDPSGKLLEYKDWQNED